MVWCGTNCTQLSSAYAPFVAIWKWQYQNRWIWLVCLIFFIIPWWFVSVSYASQATMYRREDIWENDDLHKDHLRSYWTVAFWNLITHSGSSLQTFKVNWHLITSDQNHRHFCVFIVFSLGYHMHRNHWREIKFKKWRCSRVIVEKQKICDWKS